MALVALFGHVGPSFRGPQHTADGGMVSGIEGIAGVAVQRCLRRGELKVVPRHPSTERPWLTVKLALAALAKHRATVHALCDESQ